MPSLLGEVSTIIHLRSCTCM